MTAQTHWEKLPPALRKILVWTIWFITWFFLLVGFFDRNFYIFTVVLSALHSILFLYLFNFRFSPFPVQVRLAYFLWVTIGTFVPYCIFLMYITTLGLPANLFFNYCPLARLLHLLPWNRQEPLSIDFLKRVFLSPPAKGKFEPKTNTEQQVEIL